MAGTATGAAWLEPLPALLAECADHWALTLEPPYPYAHTALCLPARRADGSAAVLKVQFPDRESQFEAGALTRWGGNGVVGLLAHDEHRHALLLERCLPGSPLTLAGSRVAVEVLAEMVNRLAIPVGAPFVSLAEEAAGWAERLPGNWGAADRPCPWSLVKAALDRLTWLAATPGAPVLVHQDLHSGNVLAAEREPWLVIDPKPLAAERAFAVAPIVRDEALGHRPAHVLERLEYLVGALELDAERARGWAIVQAVAWGFDGSGASRSNLEVAACGSWPEISDTESVAHGLGNAGNDRRVTLRDACADDLKALEAYWSPTVYQWLPAILQSNDREDVARYLQRSVAACDERPRTQFDLVAEVDGRFIGTGMVALRDRPNASGEIGYALREGCWGCGYGTQVAEALIEMGFARLDLHRIWATVHPQNVASIRVLEKAGMAYEGRLRDHLRSSGGWRDSLLFAVVRGDRSGGRAASPAT